MKVLIDKYIPCFNGVLDAYAEVQFLEPDAFTPERVRDADALVIRTRTKINRSLLDGSSVRFVATATIGFDHIDTAYCKENHIFWTSCPGCNSQAVCDYVREALNYWLSQEGNGSIVKPVLGVVGVGHVGEKVAKMADELGFHVLLNDPPKKIGCSLDEIAGQADVITFHTPLSRQGDYPSYHLCDAAFLRKCKCNALIINAARGGVVDEEALLHSGHPYILDCWENEPDICVELCQNEKALLTSFHIAGYSQEGKTNASQMCLDALCRYFHFPDLQINRQTLPPRGDSASGWLSRITSQLKASPESFESLRKSYPLR